MIRHDLTGKTILVVDDDESVTGALSRIFRHRGAITLSVSSAELALELLDDPAAVPDVIVVDVQLPGHDGVELIRRARSLHPAIGVVCVSGFPPPLGLGCDFISKPPDPEQLLDMVERQARK